jgi:hypothetical protein
MRAVAHTSERVKNMRGEIDQIKYSELFKEYCAYVHDMH